MKSVELNISKKNNTEKGERENGERKWIAIFCLNLNLNLNLNLYL